LKSIKQRFFTSLKITVVCCFSQSSLSLNKNQNDCFFKEQNKTKIIVFSTLYKKVSFINNTLSPQQLQNVSHRKQHFFFFRRLFSQHGRKCLFFLKRWRSCHHSTNSKTTIFSRKTLFLNAKKISLKCFYVKCRMPTVGKIRCNRGAVRVCVCGECVCAFACVRVRVRERRRDGRTRACLRAHRVAH
jgi:hypothetical protein